MRKLWLVARREYLKCVRTKGFLIVTLGLPAALIVVVALAIIFSGGGSVTLGYVDQSGLVREPAVSVVMTDSGENVGPSTDKARFQAFSDVAAGRSALEAKEIDALYILPPDYMASGQVQAYYWTKQPSSGALGQFKLFLRANLLAAQSAEARARVLQGPSNVIVRSADGRTSPGGDGYAGIVIPGALAFFFTFSLMASVGYLLQAVVEEKENRTVEVVTTSVSANQLIGGKTLGLVAVVLTQIFIWVGVAAAGLVVAARFVEPLREVQVGGWFLAVAVLFFVPSYVLAAGMVISIGAAVSDFAQGQQMTGVLSLLFLLPIFFVALVLQNPDSPVLVFLTIFPTTSLATVAFRWGATAIPLWQLATSWLCLTLAASLMAMVAPRIFRRGMLRYGKRMSLRGALEAVRSRGV